MPSKALHKRKRPAKLTSKLLEIRLRFNESQNGMLKRLGLEDEFERDYVSKWERGVMEPPLHVLCAYADVINVYLDVLARDILELPLEIPSKTKSMGLIIDKKNQNP
jgi:transcriptional regulator with XRE-family HTH domain